MILSSSNLSAASLSSTMSTFLYTGALEDQVVWSVGKTSLRAASGRWHSAPQHALAKPRQQLL